ncbi:MAG: DUF885 domain-containing protein [Deltaproteobacteria bacterium]|nr:DUF885 domain-containing protein [Deltaproteobacteria bacterium]
MTKETNDFSNLCDEFLKLHFQINPISATEDGYAGFNNKLPDYSEDANARYLEKAEEISQKAEAINPSDNNEKIDLDLLKRKTDLLKKDLSVFGQQRLNPIVHTGALSNGLYATMTAHHLNNKEKIESLVKRLEQIPAFLEQAKNTLEKPVLLWSRIAEQEVPALVQYIETTVNPYLQSQGVEPKLLFDQTKHALYDFSVHLEKREDKQEDFAIGSDLFEYLIKTWHGLNHTAQDLKEIGLEQIDLLNNELSKQAEKIDDLKSWQELATLLKNNHPSEEHLLDAYKQKMAEIKNFLCENDIVSLPEKESLEIINTPKFLQDQLPLAAYMHPPMFAGNGEGQFFVTPANGDLERLKEHCYASFPLTTLHEAYPGHHLQFAIQSKLKSPLRKIYNVSSYYEGWTLYCEEMMYRTGFYDDAMRLYQLKDRLWRAARIVVDVSMQCFGMTDDEAVQFLVDQAGLSKGAARGDVNWYTQSPTIPMSYLIGMLEVDRIRDDYQRKGHSLKEFHNAFLNCGAIPLGCVREILGV